MAPELGLFLDECYFDSYSKQWGHLHGALSLAPYADQAEAFKVHAPASRAICLGALWRDYAAWGWPCAALRPWLLHACIGKAVL